MDISVNKFEFWRESKDSINDRMVYEIIAEDLKSAKDKICKLLNMKNFPIKLKVRISIIILEC